MSRRLKQQFAERIAGGLSSISGASVTGDEVLPHVTDSPKGRFGDFAFPCFKVRDIVTVKMAPQQIASRLQAAVGDDETSEVGPYFNYKPSAEDLAREVLSAVRRAADEGRACAASAEGEGRTVVIEYSSPNIAKPFGVGHLRSTVIGHALVRLYEAAGYNVVKLNYPGDWGTQFGLMLTAWRRWGDEADLARGDGAGGVAYLVGLYQRANAEAKEDASLADEARAAFKRLEEGDEESFALWRRFRDASLAAFQRLYDLLGVSFDSLDGEAATRGLIPGAIAELEKRGLLKESEGARVVELGLGENVPPAMIVKSDGATTYLARDLAEILQRHERYGFEKCIYVVGRDQELHFRQLFRLVELMGFDWTSRCAHVSFGMIRFGGEKMRTRAGSTVGLEDVLDRAFEEVKTVVDTRRKDAGLDGTAQERASREVAVGAVVFADLSRRRIKDYDFDWERAFALDGDSGPYLQYAHARSCGILRKAGRDVPPEIDYSLLKSEPERELLKALGRHPEAVAHARRADEPAILAGHLVEVAGALNLFYNKCRVLGEEKPLEDARLLLVWAARQVIAEALSMLGIAAPESM